MTTKYWNTVWIRPREVHTASALPELQRGGRGFESRFLRAASCLMEHETGPLVQRGAKWTTTPHGHAHLTPGQHLHWNSHTRNQSGRPSTDHNMRWVTRFGLFHYRPHSATMGQSIAGCKLNNHKADIQYDSGSNRLNLLTNRTIKWQ